MIIDRVCCMFRTISEFSETNKMTVNNIAMVMNPSMFRDDNNSVLEFMSMGPARSKLVKTLIENYEEMFLVCIFFCFITLSDKLYLFGHF